MAASLAAQDAADAVAAVLLAATQGKTGTSVEDGEWWEDLMDDDDAVDDINSQDFDDDFNPFEQQPETTDKAQPSTLAKGSATPDDVPQLGKSRRPQPDNMTADEMDKLLSRKKLFHTSLRRSMRVCMGRANREAVTKHRQQAEEIDDARSEAFALANVLAALAKEEMDAGDSATTSSEADWLDALNAEEQDHSNAFLSSLRKSVRAQSSRRMGGRAGRSFAEETIAEDTSALSEAEQSMKLRATLLNMDEAEAALKAFSMDADAAPPQEPTPPTDSGSSASESNFRRRSSALTLDGFRKTKSHDTGSAAPLGAHDEALGLRDALSAADAESMRRKKRPGSRFGRSQPGRASLAASVRRGRLSKKAASTASQWMTQELKKLVEAIQAFGWADGRGIVSISFGDLSRKARTRFDGSFEGVIFTARQKGLVAYSGEMLCPKEDDDVAITLLSTVVPEDQAAYNIEDVKRVSVRRKPGTEAVSGSFRRGPSSKRQTSTSGLSTRGRGNRASQRLGASVRRGTLSKDSAMAAVAWADKQLSKLLGSIKKNGRKSEAGLFEIMFGVLYDETFGILEAKDVGAVLNIAREHGFVSYQGDDLRVPRDDFVLITLLQEEPLAESTEDTYSFEQIRRMTLSQ